MIKFLDLKTRKPKYTSWFFYGPTRSGKTVAASTFPYPLFLQPNLEDSVDSIAGAEGQYIELASMGAMLEVLDDLEERAQKARRLWDKGDNASLDNAAEIFPWETVILESLTHYCDIVTGELTMEARVIMDKQKWGKLGSHLKLIHSRLKALPVHVVYVALVREIHDKDTGRLVKGEPMFVGQMSDKLPSACGGVVYFEKVGKAVYRAHLTKMSKYEAGTRYPQLRGLDKMEPFNFRTLAKRLGLE